MMNAIKFCLLVVSLYLPLIVSQDVSIWDADLAAACGNTTDTECVDRHMSEIFSNLTRLYNPDGGYSNNLTYLDHHHYGPTNMSYAQMLNATLEAMLKFDTATKYNQSEIDIVKAFPRT